MATLFQEVGSAELRATVRELYDRLFADLMIGFMFAGRDKERLIEKEWELVAELLGGPVTYTGRPIGSVHARLPIMGGHFERRLKILEETLHDRGVPPAVRDVWLAHTRALRSQVTSDEGSGCDPDEASRRMG